MSIYCIFVPCFILVTRSNRKNVDLPTGEKIEEELQAQGLVWNHTLQYLNSMSLKSAVELGIPVVLHRHDGPVSLTNLAAQLSIPPNKTNSLRRLMRILVFTGYFASETNTGNDEAASYLLTPLSRHLIKDKDTGASPFVLFQLDPVFIPPLQTLAAWFRGNEPTPFSKMHGMEIFEMKERLNHVFNAAMACDLRLVPKSLVEKHRDAFEG
ncbi:Trans-resveratrol di-O-methyltransferase [Acorus calamus]|uniref:Trans-resveratrol di-O-methyltransferase n=1 Tax=Acorus calamus TaxID=4465 RepID=A0AAV9FMY2_ACOCL|nr:Trans-resveratrol di-O-methyltransferase [Acorus calamus]